VKLEKNRQFEYNLNKIADNHPRSDYYELTYTAVDNSKIYAEVMVPKGQARGLFIEIPDYKAFPKDYLNLGRYAILDYAVASLHVRGQVGRSENRQPASIYFPFLNNQNEVILIHMSSVGEFNLSKELIDRLISKGENII